MSNTAEKKEALLTALADSLGVVSTACKKANIARSTHYKWLKEDEEYKRLVKDIENITLDFGESALHNLIKEGNPAATIFFLKTKGKMRGYVETQDIQVTEKKPLTWMNEAKKD